jgi:DNA-binding transcriptional ArsR family regulator
MLNRQPLTDPAAELIAERLRVLGQPLRVKLVDRLAIRDTTVRELVDSLGTTQQNISKHLGVLRRSGIVIRHKEGTRVRYQLADSDILPILERTETSLAARLSEPPRQTLGCVCDACDEVVLEDPRNSTGMRRGRRR